MARKIQQTYIQGRLFDDDEVIQVRKKPKVYSQYTQGARDMFLKFMSVEDHERETIKHLQRQQMEAFIDSVLNDEGFLRRFLTGDKVTFNIQKNEDGNVEKIVPVIHRRKELSAQAKEVINNCTFLNETGIEINLRLNRAYIVNEIREYFGEWSYSKLCPLIREYLKPKDNATEQFTHQGDV